MVDTRQFMNITVRVRDQCLELQPNIFKAQNRKKNQNTQNPSKTSQKLEFPEVRRVDACI